VADARRSGLDRIQRRRLSPAAALIAIAVLVLVGAAAHDSPGAATLTEDGAAYAASVDRGTLTVQNRRSGSNQREIHWAVSQPDVTDSTACTTWRSGVGLSQNGLAFRIARHRGSYRAVVLERNVYGNRFTAFKLIYFSDRRFDVDPAVVDLSPYLVTADRTAVYPLRVCAQLRGSRLAFTVARDGDVMPPFGTAGRGGTFEVHRPPSRGATGIYVAHVPRGTSAVIDAMTLDGNTAPPPGV
jgi:hypothetical protein